MATVLGGSGFAGKRPIVLVDTPFSSGGKDDQLSLKFKRTRRRGRTRKTTKYCPKCEKVLPVSEFAERKTGATKYQAYCKPCFRAEMRVRDHDRKVKRLIDEITE